MKCELVDVFAQQKLNGNALTIFSECDHLSDDQMLAWTQEMRQFESIFLRCDNGIYSARIFTVEEELDFAGHPLLGLAFHLHQHFGSDVEHQWSIELSQRRVQLTSRQDSNGFIATMSQGKPDFIKTLSEQEAAIFYRALNLVAPTKVQGGTALSAEVISTGLPYIILPVTSGLKSVQFTQGDISALLSPHAAKFLYVLDVENTEGRTWDNAGNVEDVATGSAAGPAAAYLYKHNLLSTDNIVLKQGRFVDRPSEIMIELVTQQGELADIKVSGHVVKVANIELVE